MSDSPEMIQLPAPLLGTKRRQEHTTYFEQINTPHGMASVFLCTNKILQHHSLLPNSYHRFRSPFRCFPWGSWKCAFACKPCNTTLCIRIKKHVITCPTSSSFAGKIIHSTTFLTLIQHIVMHLLFGLCFFFCCEPEENETPSLYAFSMQQFRRG